MSTITGKKGLSFLIFTAFLGSYVLTACGGGTSAQPTQESAPTLTYTPSPTATRTPRPTPTPVYQEVQGMNVPTNVYLEGDECIPMELQGVEKCVNMFVYGDRFTVAKIWQGIVHVIGDVMAYNLTMEPGTEAYVAANSDIHNLFTENKYDMMSGINTTNEVLDGVHPGEPFRDEPHKISIQAERTININGTEENPVLITSSAEEPLWYDWNRLESWGNSKINYAVIEYLNVIVLNSGSVISNSIIRHTICLCTDEANNVKIINNQIYDTGHELIGIRNSGVYIEGNELGPNMTYDQNNAGGRGIVLDLSEGGQVEIYNNIFHDINFAAILPIGSAPKIPFMLEGNTFYNNRRDIDCPSTQKYCSNNMAYFFENNTFGE